MPRTARTIFDISDDLLALNDLLDESGGELPTPEAEAAIESWFTELAADQAAKLDGYVGLIRHLETQAAVAREAAEDFQRKARAEGNKARRLKDRLMLFLQATGQAKATTARGWTVAVRPNGGEAPVSLNAEDISVIPEQYRRVRVEADREAIREALLAGVSLPFARLVERGRHLRILPS